MHVDVMIIGGGMVGAAMAKALSNSALQVGLIDAAPLSTAIDHRLIALNYSSVCFFKNLNLWSSLEKEAAPIDAIHISKLGSFGSTRILAADAQLPALGYVVPAKFIMPVLEDSLKSILHIRPGKLKKLDVTPTKTIVTIETPAGIQEISATIVIGADGSHSTVRELLNISIEKTDYQQSALVTTTSLQRTHKNIAYERFQSNGAIAMLPLRNQEAATIWSGKNAEIDALMQLDEIDFLAKLQQQFGYRLGRFKSVGSRYRYPLYRIQASQQKIGNTVLIGNAAHTLHPITAQGLNLSIYEIALLAEHLSSCSRETLSLDGLDLPSSAFTLDLSHQVSQVFSSDFFLFNTARQLGLIGLDLSKTLKALFTRKLLGHSGHFPSLLKDIELDEYTAN